MRWTKPSTASCGSYREGKFIVHDVEKEEQSTKKRKFKAVKKDTFSVNLSNYGVYPDRRLNDTTHVQFTHENK